MCLCFLGQKVDLLKFIAPTKVGTKEPPHRPKEKVIFQKPSTESTVLVIGFCSTLKAASLEFQAGAFLPEAVCVQRFGNKMVLQLIPLIALCCVLQRNRKPSHPSRHVVGAIDNKRFLRSCCVAGWGFVV
jgi:hypothetical protein